MHFNVQLNYKIYNKNAAFLLLCGGKRSRGLGTSPQNIKTKIDKLKVFKYIISFFIQLFPVAKSCKKYKCFNSIRWNMYKL